MNKIQLSHFHTTWEEPYRGSLYYIAIIRIKVFLIYPPLPLCVTILPCAGRAGVAIVRAVAAEAGGIFLQERREEMGMRMTFTISLLFSSSLSVLLPSFLP